MEIMNAKDTGEPHASLSTKCHENSILVSCNWQITNNKQFIDVITTASLRHAPAKINCEDVAFLDTSIALQSSNFEPCMLDIKVTNCQKIARIAIVSEGNVLEIFKQYGEYETTILAEFIDEYEENIVFLGETMIQPPTTEASIKFTRTKNKSSMWIYGIRLFLIDSIKEAKPSAFNPDIIQTFLSNRNGKVSQGAEMAMKLLGYYDKQEILNKEQFCQKNLETLVSNSEYSECKNGIGRKDNEKDCSNCEDNYEKSISVECKSEIERRDNENEFLNCKEDYKQLDMDVSTCMNSEMKSVKKTKPGTFNCKDFIQTFLSNSNGNMSQETEMAIKMLGYYNKQKMVKNDEFYQGNLKTLTLNSEYLGYKNKNEKEDNEKECLNHEDEHEKLNFFENRNVKRASKKDNSNCGKDSKNFDIDIKTYIDNKFYDMENKLMKRIDEMEVITNQKLNAILERLETLKLN